MKKLLLTLVCVLSAAALLKADSYNQSITAIFGGGNPNTGWTADAGGGITLGLRGKNRDTGATPNVNGVYSFATGYNVANNRARWNYEFSIDAGSLMLSDYDYFLGIDLDPSQGISYNVINPIAAFNDNSYGNSSTLNGQGFEGPAAGNAALADANSVLQNSQNIVFLGLDPTQNATFNYELFAVAKGDGVNGNRLADVGITVVVGTGGAAVPDTGSTAAMISLGLAGLVGLRSRRRAA